jgi:hypothetical protein
MVWFFCFGAARSQNLDGSKLELDATGWGFASCRQSNLLGRWCASSPWDEDARTAPRPGQPWNLWSRPFAKKSRSTVSCPTFQTELRVGPRPPPHCTSRPRAAEKQRRRTLKQCLLRRMDLAGTRNKPARQLGYHAFLPQDRQRNLCLDFRTVPCLSTRHVSASAGRPFESETLSIATWLYSYLASFRGHFQPRPAAQRSEEAAKKAAATRRRYAHHAHGS